MREETKLWMRQAEEDMKTAESLFKDKRYYASVNYCHQAVEKSLKAYLISKNKSLRKVHDVVGLLEDCIKIDEIFREIQEQVQTVYPYYIKTRYPSYEDVDQFTKEQAEEAYEYAKTVLEFVKEKLEKYEQKEL